MTGVEDLDVQQTASIADAWIGAFTDALRSGTSSRIDDLFVSDAWWRDLLLLDWDLQTQHGLDALNAVLDQSRERGLRVVHDVQPSSQSVCGPAGSWIEVKFSVTTAVSEGRALARLITDPDDCLTWKAWTLCTAVDQLRGVAENVGDARPRGGKQVGVPPVQDSGEVDPRVVVVGGGQAGLSVAARLTALGVPCVVLERNARVGDNWRNRYDSLVLHDPVWSDHLPYLPFPKTWPLYMEKDRVGNWLEIYAAALDLRVWTSASVTAGHYEPGEERWHLRVASGDGRETDLTPAHVVVATGATGSEPHRPLLEGESEFSGSVLHSSEYVRPDGMAGKRALVVGSGNSAHDIAQDLAEAGAAVTMLQRSATYVTSAANVPLLLDPLFGEHVADLEESDFVSASFPLGAAVAAQQVATRLFADLDRELLDGLRRAGFALTFGPDDTGLTRFFLERGGGYYLNVGASELIASGQIKIMQGEIDRLTRDGVVFSDGSSGEADTIILATGFLPMSSTLADIVGPEAASRCDPRWGLDANGELHSMWRPSPQPGLWFAGGNLSMCRYFSKFLALHIKAIEAGLKG